MNFIINLLLFILFLVCGILILKKMILNSFAPIKSEMAEVFDKYKVKKISNYPGVEKMDMFTVVFKTENEKLSFNISSFSAVDYKIGEKGMLKYKGDKIISFD